MHGILNTPVLLCSHERCWKCSANSPVYGFGGESFYSIEDDQLIRGYDGFLTINNIRGGDEHLKSLIASLGSVTYRFSKASGEKYFMNTCLTCGAPMGDYYLFSEPGGAFQPTSEHDVHARKLSKMAIQCAQFRVDADFTSGSFCELIKHLAFS